MIKILITGAAGYIGSVLTNELIKNKFNKITVVDKLIFGQSSLKSLIETKQIEFFNYDVRDYNKMKDLFECPNKLPSKIQAILRRFNDLEIERGIQYADLIQMGKEMANYGYSFDFYLDCVPYNLKKIKN